MPDHAQRDLLPMDPQIRDIQPGGGVIIKLEQMWGFVRRFWLKTFRRGYVEQMRLMRKGDRNVCPHDVLDPRDVKFYQNQGGYYWEPKDDPFRWRDQLPFARAGLAELFVFDALAFGYALVLAIALCRYEPATWVKVVGWLLVVTGVVIGILITWFFRNPRRFIPDTPGTVVSPADGKIVAIEEILHDDFIGGPALHIGIFLSIFNVHINRVPLKSRVVGLKYKAGKYLNALRPESARENEQVAILLQETDAPHRPMVVRQITGAIARRIVCWVKPGDVLSRGEQCGMIKLGSRTELIIPLEEGMQIITKIGQHVKAGSSVLVQYK
jgi:phosphatidylserine decarboxylase